MMEDTHAEKAGSQREDVCRDFLRNACNRGKKCRFKHPSSQASHQAKTGLFDPREEKQNFCKHICHDYQNTGCSRSGCKFVHCSNEVQEEFLETGVLPMFVLEDAIAKAVIPSLPGEAPVCKDYLSGECRRGKGCRFRHMSHCKYRKELEVLFGIRSPSPEASSSLHQQEAKRMKTSFMPSSPFTCETPHENHSFSHNSFQHDACQHSRFTQSASHLSGYQAASYANQRCCDALQEIPVTHPTSLQEENAILKKQLYELRRQVSDLMTANEFLLDQNAALRLMRKNNGMMTLQSTGPATLNGTGQQLVASVPVSIAPVSGPGPQMTLAMAGQNTQQLLPVSCHAPGQQLMTAVNTVTVAGQTGNATLLATAVPVSVSNTANQLVPVSAVPVVSLATVSMAPVHMPPIVTAACTTPHSIAMSASAATSLVSYPIMTQPLLQTR